MGRIGRNCEGMSRRDSLALGLGGLIAGGLSGALRASAAAAGEPADVDQETGRRLHSDLDGRRTKSLRDVRPQTGSTRWRFAASSARSRPRRRGFIFRSP